MYFKQFLDEKVGCASYLIASRKTNEAAIVDPGIVTEAYEELLRLREFTLKYVIDTHVHADHVSGARKLRDRHGAELCLHESAKVDYPFRGLKDGEELPLGQLILRIEHTPGHRPELISVLVINPERSAEPSMVMTGDSLLVGDVGRPDFGGGDAEQQYESIQKLMELEDWVAVFPGHFEGPCGKGMCGRPSTTIGFERNFNPLTEMDREHFLETLNDGIPARPLNMVAIEATNRGKVDMPWAMLTELHPISEISVNELEHRPDGSLLIDVREPEEYACGHVPGAFNLPQSELASRLDELPRDEQVYVICQAAYRSTRAAQFLAQMGFSNVINVAGGTTAWIESGRSVDQDESGAPRMRIIETEWAHAGVALD
ncbi:MAG: rhodanese-like domain-containing protein [Thermomicrobiales bacterium]